MRASPRRRGRRRPERALSREKIVAQALALLDDAGAGAFSIRRLAEALGVTPMAVYHYFESRDELLRGVVSAVLDGVEIPARGDSEWRAATCKLLVSLRRQLLAHPHVLALLGSEEYWGPTLIRVSDQLLRLLAEAGFSKKGAARAHRALLRHTFGSLLLTASDPKPDRAGRRERVRRQIRRMPAGEVGLIDRMLPLVLPVDVDLEREFAFSLERLLAGLAAELPHS
jgi:TetR/AcrR family tetracycline transcriptional repressor